MHESVSLSACTVFEQFHHIRLLPVPTCSVLEAVVQEGKKNSFPLLSEYNSLQVIFQMSAVPVSPVQVPPR